MSENNEIFDQEEEINYMPSNWSHRYDKDHVIENFIKVRSKWNEKIIKIVPHRLNVMCEVSKVKGMDIFSEDLPNDSPILAFIHGGFWIEESKECYHFLAEPLRKKGIVTVLIGYNLAPSVTIIEIVEEIKQMISNLIQLAENRRSRGIYLSGHSAGAHLLSMVFASDWMDDLIKNYIKGTIFISGIYDLVPLLQTSICNVIKEVIEKVNVSKFIKEISSMLKQINAKVLVAVAEYDSPKFIDQSENYHKKLLEYGVPARYILVRDEDHFSIIEKLHDESFVLTKRILNLIYEEE